ncbi:MAG: SCO family protein [Steroidobacteraceae bacterium]
MTDRPPTVQREYRAPELRLARVHRRARHCGLVGVLILAAGLMVLAGCSRQPPFKLQSISGLVPALQFNLTDGDGRAVTAQNYRGDVVLLYFGYTHCPDVCPTTLAMLAQAIKGLGASASKVRVLFVSVDPRRDTAALMKRYVSYFGPQFVGLRGADNVLRPLTRRYRIAYHADPPDSYGNYAVEHSSAVFIFDQTGHARLLALSGDAPASITQDLSRLLNSN